MNPGRRYRWMWAVVGILAAWGIVADAEPLWPASRETLEAFFDPIFAEAMPRAHVPGAVIAVVHGEDLLFSKGYGTARLGEDIPIDPATTLFRVASLSKLFVATAIMQLYEEGKVDLDADVNRYLKTFQLPATFPDPVTLCALLTHSAGFDDRFLGMGAPTHDAILPLGDYLAARMPPRVMPPGLVISYSNHGMALAGYVVEAVSGKSFGEYVRERIFAPLGMAHSDFDLVPDAATPLATGYNYYLGKHHEALYDYAQTVPVSSLAMSADDMARFMSAHLQLGRLGTARILREETVRLMQEPHLKQDPRFSSGWAYGFSTHTDRGRRVLQHTGLIWGFTSLLLLLPDENTGLFVSSTTDRGQVNGAACGGFLGHFFPAEEKLDPAPAAPPEGWEDRIERVCGHYRQTRYCRTTFFKLGVMLPPFVEELVVRRGEEPGILLLGRAGGRGAPGKLLEIEPYFFAGFRGDDPKDRRLSDTYRVAFKFDEARGATYLCRGTSSYERLRWWESWPMLAGAAAGSMLAMLSAWLAWPVQVWRRKRRGLTTPAWARRARAAALAVSGLNLLFVALFVAFIFTMTLNDIGYGVPLFLKAILALPLAAAALTPFLYLGCALVWRRGYGILAGRVHYALVAAAATLFLVLLNYWNLFGYKFS